jgi:hypothetical protein
MYGQSQCHYQDQEDGCGNNYRLTHGITEANTASPRSVAPRRARIRTKACGSRFEYGPLGGGHEVFAAYYWSFCGHPLHGKTR